AELAHECGQTDRALKLARDALKLAEENRNRKFRVRGLLILGKVEAELGHDSSAMDQLQEAQRLAEASDFQEWLRDAHHALGALHVELARFDTAEKHFLRAQELSEQLAEGLPDDLKRIYLTDRRRKRVADDLATLRERMLDTRTEITLAHRSTFKRRITDLEVSHSRLLKILEINKALNSEHRVGPLLDLIMDGVIELTDAERGFLILREGIGEGDAASVHDGDANRSVTDFGDGLQVVAARNINREAISGAEFRISHSIAEQAMRAGHPVIVTNAQEDERFREQQSVEDLNLRSVCCFPLKGKGGVLGAMYLDNRFRKGVFSEGDLRVLEAFGDQAALAIENARLHADIVAKAENIEELNAKLESRLQFTTAELAEAKEKLETTQRETELKYDYSNLVGRDGGLRGVCKVLDRVIPTEWPVVIQGEPGTGKELIAKAIHFNGPRKEQSFVAENCAAISESLLESELFGHVKGAFTGASSANRGLFQAADGGTLFLDEIGEMSLGMQAKLLRVLQESEVRPVGGETTTKVDVRIVAATNRDLKQMIEEGTFREDLYYRIANLEIELPPLRERREDIPALANHVLAQAATEQGVPAPELSRETLAALMDHDWPGNVRELENEMKRVLTLADGPVATPESISERIRGAEITKGVEKIGRGEGTLKEAMAEVEKAILLKALEKNRWNKSATAKELGISRVGLHKKCAKYGIK
ncbi:MAG: sigma-54-dependent Fis family transcriptional regulator, partial [Planctomycetota bacterium]